MPQNRPQKFSPTSTNSSFTLLPFPYIGLVKNNIDTQNMGRLSVWIPEIGGNPTDPSSWIICSYCSPFYGSTNPATIDNYQSNNNIGQQSYGFIGVPPDLNCEVMVQFVNGDVSRAYWTGCTIQQNMNYMVPGIASAVNTTPNSIAPATEYNKATIQGDPTNPPRPIFTPLATGLTTEGLTGDGERGPSNTSMRRESPPLVYGLLSPRGNSIHIDDNFNGSNEFIRFRTRSGTQILIHETTGYVYINSKAGNSWMEISDNGINAYTANSLSLRAQADFNIRADRNVNIDAGVNVNIRAGAQITMNAGTNIEAVAASDIAITTSANLQVTAATNINLTATTNIEIGATQNLNLSAGAASTLKVANDYQVKAGGNLRLQSTQDMTLLAGSHLRLQSTQDTSSLAGGNWYRSATTVYDLPEAVEGSAAPPATPATAATATTATTATTPPTAPQLDTTQTFADGGSGATSWSYGSQNINTIVSVMPTHEPWRGHPGAFIPPLPASGLPVQSGGAYSNGGSASSSSPFSNTPSSPSTTPNSSSLTNSGCSFGVANTAPCSTAVYYAITDAASKTGADAATMFAFADIESTFNPNASAGSSSASGLYQFISATWTSMISQYGNQFNVPTGASVFDPNYNALMGGAYIQNNASILLKKGINSPTPGQLYLMHFLGSGGGPSMIAANQSTPDASAASLFSAAAAANRSLFYNSDGSAKSVGTVYNAITTKVDSKAAAYANQFGLQAPCQRGNGVAGNSPSTPAPSPNTNATAYQNDVGQVYGTGTNRGQCVPLVKQICSLPAASTWQQGKNVQELIQAGTPPPVGTGIATFGRNGTYTSSLDGTSHAAVFLGTNSDNSAMTVLDQYVGTNGVPVPSRIHNIPFNSTTGLVISNASNYCVINTPTMMA